MANYYTHFSCTLDVGTQANATRALEIYNTAIVANDPLHPVSEGFALSIDELGDGTKLSIFDEGSGDPECVIAFVQLCAEAFDLTGLWGFQYADTCSSRRVDAFGGGAHVLDLGTRKTVDYFHTHEWLTIVLDGGDPDE